MNPEKTSLADYLVLLKIQMTRRNLAIARRWNAEDLSLLELERNALNAVSTYRFIAQNLDRYLVLLLDRIVSVQHSHRFTVGWMVGSTIAFSYIFDLNLVHTSQVEDVDYYAKQIIRRLALKIWLKLGSKDLTWQQQVMRLRWVEEIERISSDVLGKDHDVRAVLLHAGS